MSFAPDITEVLARARADLRMGVPVVLRGAGGAAVLMLAAETLDAQRLADLRALGGAPVLAITRDLLNRLVGNEVTLEEAVEAGELESGPGLDVFRQVGEHLDEFDLWFPIIEP